LTLSPYASGKPAGAGAWGATFDGDDDSIKHNAALHLTPLTTSDVGITMWVYPTNDTGRQGLYYNGVNDLGVAITAEGKWTQIAAGHTNDTDILATENVLLNQWTHVMQHTYSRGAPNSPSFIEGTGTGGDYISVLYVNGTAVSAHVDNHTIDADGPLLFGAEFPGSEENFFEGVIGDAESYADDGFRLFTDNILIVSQIAVLSSGAILDGDVLNGDVNVDGTVDEDDITAFVAGWKSKNRIDGFHGDLYVGDLSTWRQGDLNLDGRVELDDAFLLHQALAPMEGFPFDLLTGQSAEVPEPSTSMLLGLLIAMSLMQAWKSRESRSFVKICPEEGSVTNTMS
jgi:hypothetical protein